MKSAGFEMVSNFEVPPVALIEYSESMAPRAFRCSASRRSPRGETTR
jgi:hypothetical protein